MDRSRLLLSLACVAFWQASALAADLTGIDRAISKEPAYKGKPKYCLVVFGPEAKVRTWLVLDGETLYVDRNCNGDLTEKNERLTEERAHPHHEFPVVDLALPDEMGRNVSLQVTVPYYREEGADQESSHPGLNVYIDRKKWTAPVKAFSDTPKDAPIIHFNGPLTFLCPYLRAFEPGKAARLTIHVGTPGSDGVSYAWCYAKDVVGAEGRVLVVIEFPNKDPDGKRLRTAVSLGLDDCQGSHFTGEVSVPADAAPGKATMTLLPRPELPNLAPAAFYVGVVGIIRVEQEIVKAPPK